MDYMDMQTDDGSVGWLLRIVSFLYPGMHGKHPRSHSCDPIACAALEGSARSRPSSPQSFFLFVEKKLPSRDPRPQSVNLCPEGQGRSIRYDCMDGVGERSGDGGRLRTLYQVVSSQRADSGSRHRHERRWKGRRGTRRCNNVGK